VTLGELIYYLDHEKSGASGFQDMGQAWVAVRDGARQGTLRGSDPAVRDVALRWEQLLDYLALGECDLESSDGSPRIAGMEESHRLLSRLAEQGARRLACARE
jgi:hypothetical protein